MKIIKQVLFLFILDKGTVDKRYNDNVIMIDCSESVSAPVVNSPL